ncbi:unnamed protein product [Clonostachys rosea]|uniref:Alpha/beta hydrolase fold-3 domain-containing protein n=1 Tax=Bionectria ochroleuca TaxID=29856 RepID=A0ABY6UYT5_BIOOC|nr:unnamed protein product [Clonostachys rosea]
MATANIDDPETWSQWGRMDPELKKIIEADKNPAFKKTPDLKEVVSTREAWNPKYKAFADKVLASTSGSVTLKEIQIPRRDGGTQRALVYEPSTVDGNSRPLLVLIHGGGFCYGSPEMEGASCVKAAERYGCVAISLSYRLAPEHKFPTATDDCWDALKWLSQNSRTFGVDAFQGFVLGGTSAGGNIAIVLSHLAKEQQLQPPLTGIYLNVPLVLAPEAIPEKYALYYKSRDQNAFSPVLNKAFMDMYTEAYEPDLQSHIWSPINWPEENKKPHEGLPRTYFQVCGLDPLRDEALIYERILRINCGIETRVDVYPGLPHMFVPNYPSHSSGPKYGTDTMAGIGWLLRRLD